ncbi:MAG: PEGA domain-containing protein [Candidatus Doudnabacteria bacterium]|nr:PEGA domain-containing protein [Candidatus Doudnabacteria bacterium]
MRLRNRFLLVGLGVLLFVLLTPALILFAGGFKFDFSTFKIIKTGSLVVRSEPSRAEIFIDSEKKRSTPAVIRFLTPNDYTITISKNNYQSWTKRLAIRSQLVTWANLNRDFITLFMATPILQKKSPAQTSNQEDQDITAWQIIENRLVRVNPNDQGQQVVIDNLPSHETSKIILGGNYLFLLLDSTLYKLNDGLEQIYQPVVDANWDKPSDKLVLFNNNEILLYDPISSSSPDLVLRSISPISAAKLNWFTGYVFFQNEGKIKAIELDGRDHRNTYTIVDAMDDFELDEKGKILQVFDQKEVKEYQIR